MSPRFGPSSAAFVGGQTVARGETLEGNFPAAQAPLMGKELLEKGLETEMGRPPGKQLDPEELKKEIEGVKADVKTHVK